MQELLKPLLDTAGKVLLGKEEALKLSLSCLLAKGHILIEDVPGVGKTTLAHLWAHLLGLEYQRIQFTADLLPADVIGISVYERDSGEFRFHPGPVFSQVILADEINRATPKTQSALLEAMEEHQVTVDGHCHSLPSPFFVIATQNPQSQIGTFPLPESQLDRFLMCLTLGYPDHRAERALLKGQDRAEMMAELKAMLTHEQLLAMQAEVRKMHVSDALLDYVQALLEASRDPGHFELGLSPRAGLGLMRAAQSWAWVRGGREVLPEDVQAVGPAVIGHRLRPLAASETGPAAAARLLSEVAVP